MADVLMRLCTYDDRAAAERDGQILRDAGLRAVVADCLLEDPEQPGVKLVDLIVFDSDLERAQDILKLYPPEPTEPEDPVAFARANRWARILLVLLGIVAVGLVVGGLISLANGRMR